MTHPYAATLNTDHEGYQPLWARQTPSDPEVAEDQDITDVDEELDDEDDLEDEDEEDEEEEEEDASI
jgi:hypothetical protein